MHVAVACHLWMDNAGSFFVVPCQLEPLCSGHVRIVWETFQKFLTMPGDESQLHIFARWEIIALHTSGATSTFLPASLQFDFETFWKSHIFHILVKMAGYPVQMQRMQSIHIWSNISRLCFVLLSASAPNLATATVGGFC